jgi:hypothetical protein
MKSLIIILISSFNLFGQYNECSFYLDLNGRKIFTEVSEKAKPVINDGQISTYFLKNIKLDSLDIIESSSSKTIVKVIVSEQGEIIDRKIIQEGYNGVAEQIFEIMTKIEWEPANCNDKKVCSELIFPLQICLDKL